ncbi:MAG: phospholipid carrier-dependent glycosyltransferase [Candidatus Shapirobacteria bacterium]|nr:phospholipid carrier-dependent glycosyltransferase [Candidatus Shapirobacteria bacterium]MDD3002458.1 phospholipid carrier-dependent glycosyltransferase [Candidatus Shapirobacteria bacterium]MDD4383353.1 phospholipid carrier-dependent glycosyltransferase [Candidatus Shapirobacteria bacterium]
MKPQKIYIIYFLITVLVLFLSHHFYYIKWLGYERIPDTTIFDERNYPFVGDTFRKTGIPTGWTNMDVYKILDDQKTHNKGFNGVSITVNNQNPTLKNISDFNYPVTFVTDVDIGKGKETIRLVQPFFDHPIFGSFLFSLGIKSDVSSFDSLKPAEYRQIALYLSLITGVLIFIFGFLLYKNLIVSFLSLIIYSTVTTFVLMSRFALFENILIPFSLLIFSLIILFIQNKNKKLSPLLLLTAGIFSGLAFITKESAIFIILAVLVFLFKEKIPFKKYLYFLIPFIIISSLYYGYMYYLAPDLFFKLLFDQANRGFYGPLGFLSSVIGPNFKNFPKEGYWIFGLISLFTICYKNTKKHFYIITVFTSYLFVFLFLGGSNYPWYSLPFMPFLIIASGYFLYKLLTEPSLISLAIFYILPFLSSFYWGYFTYKTNNNNYSIFRFSLLFFILLYITEKYLTINIKIFNKQFKLGYIIWIISLLLVFWQMNKWNLQGFQYIIANWGKLPEIFTF